MEYVNFTAIIKDGGYEKLAITPKMFGELAISIQKNGSEHIHLKDKSMVVVGILIVSKEVGDRVIMCGDSKQSS
jgi:hypothetical protein